MKKLITCICAFAAFSAANAADIYVSATATDGGDGTKSAPLKSLSSAIETAVDNDVIYLSVGRYLPELQEEARKSTFKISGKSLSIIGGYNESFSDVVGQSILTADVNGDDVYEETTGILLANYEDNCTRVMTVASNSNVTLKNLFMQGGYADMTDSKLDTGGGMYIGSPVNMENCTITGNYCKNSAGGGGICVKGDFTGDNCWFYGNQGSGDGGAIFIKGDINVKITNTRFENNRSTSGSAVFFNNALSCYFASNSFTGNTSQTYGTFTVYNKSFSGVITLVNNTFANNAVTGNTTGKTLCGGAGVYAYTKANGKVNVINNTIIGNTIEGYSADGTPSEQMGGALFARLGTVTLANNVIAGNTSLSGYGDVYKVDAAVLDSKEYNFYTSYDNLNVTPERNDIVAGLDRNSGMTKCPSVFDCTLENGKIVANAADNGGATKTVKVVGEGIDFDGLTVASIPAENLTEATLGVDLDNDSATTGKLTEDQRGAKRNQTGAAYIGAYEFDPKFTAIESIGDNSDKAKLQVHGGEVILPTEKPCAYEVYDIIGKTVISGTAQNSINLKNTVSDGLYIVRVYVNTQPVTVKIVL